MTQSREAASLQALTQAVPDWEQLQAHPLWGVFLAQETPDGMPRRDIFRIHGKAHNVAGLAKLFAQFKAFLEQGRAHRPQQPTGSMATMPFPLTALGYHQWKTACVKAGGVWRGDKELTKQINAQYEQAIASGRLK